MLEISALAFLEIQKLPTFVRAFSISVSPFPVLSSLSLTLMKEEVEVVSSPKTLCLSLSETQDMCHNSQLTRAQSRAHKRKIKIIKEKEEGVNKFEILNEN